MAIFTYGEAETAYLASRDVRLGRAIAAIGHVERAVDPNLFSSVMHHIIGQQISTKAQATIWGRLEAACGAVTPRAVLDVGRARLQGLGMTFRKADYLLDFAQRVEEGAFDLEAVRAMDDEEAIAALSTIKGIGRWTAEMILLFCLERPDILAADDLAIQRGLRMLYRHREITPARFERFRRRYSPYGSVASLYLWAIAGGALPGVTDPATRRVPGAAPRRRGVSRTHPAAHKGA